MNEFVSDIDAPVLGIDTSGPVAVAVIGPGGQICRVTSEQQRAHVEQLAPLIARCLDEAGVRVPSLGGIAVNRGPAPFTGLRIGLITARALADAAALPVWGVCGLDALAAQAYEGGVTGNVVATADAKRKEIYSRIYAKPLDGVDPEALTEPIVGPAAEVGSAVAGSGIVDGTECTVIGEGTRLYPEELGAEHGPFFPDPAMIALLASIRATRGIDQNSAPMYLRRPDIHSSRSRKRVTAP